MYTFIIVRTRNIMYWLLSSLIYIILLTINPLYTADKRQTDIELPADVWVLIAQRTGPTATDSLKTHANLLCTSKKINAQQPTYAQFNLNISAFKSHIFQMLKYDSGDTVADQKRLERLAQLFLLITNKSGELLFDMIPYSSGTVECKRREKLTLYIISMGDSVNYTDAHGATALHKAILGPIPTSADNSIVKALLEKGANPNTQLDTNNFNYNIYSMYCRQGTKITALDLAIDHSAYIHYRFNAPLNNHVTYDPYKRAQIKRALTNAQKLVVTGAAFSPGSDSVPQILNKHLPQDESVLPSRIKRLSTLDIADRYKFLAMNYDEALAEERKDPSPCSIL